MDADAAPPRAGLVGGTTGKIDHVRTTDALNTRRVSSIEKFDTRSLEVERSSADIYVTGGSHDTDAISFAGREQLMEVGGERADRVARPVGRRG